MKSLVAALVSMMLAGCDAAIVEQYAYCQIEADRAAITEIECMKQLGFNFDSERYTADSVKAKQEQPKNAYWVKR
ncbi:MAG: hypothetical protein JWN13_4940 [Betaproteobacteria bacterium]|nr:hypothetical protein [Betaproteobacteria bacterium]